MRLVVAFVDDIEAVLVAEVQEARVRRVVTGPDRVDVVLLHQQDVAEHVLRGQGATTVGVPLVAIDAPEEDAPAVDGQEAVEHGNGAETDAQGNRLPARAKRPVIQAGLFGRPCFDVGQQMRARSWHLLKAELRNGEQRGDVGDDPQRAGPVHMVEVGVDKVVVNGPGRPGDHAHVAEDPGQPPHVLVLQVARRRPLVHPHRHDVRSRAQV